MSLSDGHQAIISRIVEQASVSVVLPNGPGRGLPRYVIQEIGGAQQTSMLAGDTDADPEVAVRVETRDGQYATQANLLTRQLVAMFPVGLRFGDSGRFTVLRAPNVRPALPPVEGVYAVPVFVSARFTFRHTVT